MPVLCSIVTLCLPTAHRSGTRSGNRLHHLAAAATTKIAKLQTTTIIGIDGSAGDADYGAIGSGYVQYRQPDRQIAAQIHAALGDAHTVLNVGAGAGSYEPENRLVTAVEPSATMRAQRPTKAAVAIDATAERLPFEDNSFDAAMATFTLHQWDDLTAGLRQIRRVSTGPVVILTCDPLLLDRFWLNDYAPQVIATEARRYLQIDVILAGLGGGSVLPLSIPLNCKDGFGEAYYGRPELLLDPGARLANSAWSFVEPATQQRFERRLRSDLDDGTWQRRYGHLRTQPYFEGSLVLIVSP